MTSRLYVLVVNGHDTIAFRTSQLMLQRRRDLALQKHFEEECPCGDHERACGGRNDHGALLSYSVNFVGVTDQRSTAFIVNHGHKAVNSFADPVEAAQFAKDLERWLRRVCSHASGRITISTVRVE